MAPDLAALVKLCEEGLAAARMQKLPFFRAHLGRFVFEAVSQANREFLAKDLPPDLEREILELSARLDEIAAEARELF